MIRKGFLLVNGNVDRHEQRIYFYTMIRINKTIITDIYSGIWLFLFSIKFELYSTNISMISLKFTLWFFQC